MSTSAPLVYLYGIVRTDLKPDFGTVSTPVGEVEFGPCRHLSNGGLSAIVSTMKPPEGRTLDDILQDDRGSKDLVLHHHRTLEALVGRQTVLPLRFGAVFGDDQGVERVMRHNHEALQAALDRIDGSVEWGLKIFCDRDRLGQWLASDNPAIAEMKEKIADASEGKGFFLGRQLDRLREKEADSAIARSIDRTVDRLGGVSRDIAVGKTQPAELHGHDSEMVFNVACLVNQGLEQSWFQVVDDLGRAYADFGFGYERTGPWPPYSFVSCKLEGDEDAA